MYDINLDLHEKIKLISDNTVVYTKDGEIVCTSIITDKRYLLLDYPSKIHNSMEDLRMSMKMTYIKRKEVIWESEIDKITKLAKDDDWYKISIKDNGYLLIRDSEVELYLNGIKKR